MTGSNVEVNIKAHRRPPVITADIVELAFALRVPASLGIMDCEQGATLEGVSMWDHDLRLGCNSSILNDTYHPRE